MDRRAAIVATLALLLAAPGCGMLEGLVATRIEVKGGARSLEEQVLGSYSALGREVYALAGVRSVDPMTGQPQPPPPMTASREQALAARRRMEYNRDDVLTFKRNRYVGERSDGLLEILNKRLEPLQDSDPRAHRLVIAITEEENEDRRTIMRRIVDTTPELRGEEGMRSVGRILAGRRRQEAEPGMMIQGPDGAWVQKGRRGQ